ncbi:uncharacterized protein LOC115888445 [Sitophilus oryzae]|uniref:Uncharacterized protein LOC115888445 n=1 Tax=Sitophilus oryzae TaxID=7048 RepID=A0A6J2YL84_SITOR|nr:uncharacterized protein LOC115888445 [Sitophilus oryzae]
MICRLCRSTENLISMFCGKSKELRNFIRKIIDDTLQIQILESDLTTVVCINCCLDSVNFFYFKENCSKLQEQLTTIDVHSKAKISKPNFEKPNLSDIPKPNLKSTEEVLSWLQSKCVQITEDQESNVPIQNELKNISNNSTQTEVVKTQCQESQSISVKLCDVQVQYNNVNITDSKMSQTDSIPYETKAVQATLKVSSNDKFTQVSNNCVENKTTKKNNARERDFKMMGHDFPVSKKNKAVQTTIETLSSSKEETKAITKFNGIKHKKSPSSGSGSFNKCIVLKRNLDLRKSLPKKRLSFTSKDDEIFESGPDKKGIVLPDTNENTKGHLNKDEEGIKDLPDTNEYTNGNLSKDAEGTTDLTEKDNLLSVKDASPESSNVVFYDKSPEIVYTRIENPSLCSVCSKPYLNISDLRYHYRTHRECFVCKKKFRSIKLLINHLNKCKMTLTNSDMLPLVELNKAEHVPAMVYQYPEAFMWLKESGSKK